MTLYRIQCTWSQASSGLPGYSSFYATTAGALQGQLPLFWTAIAAYVPTGVTVTTPTTGDVIDETTGQKTGTWTSGSPGTMTGTANGVFSAPSGANVRWVTSDYVRGRHVVGRTFLVPLGGVCYSTAGQLLPSVATAINNSASALVSGSGQTMSVWNRPKMDYSVKPPVQLFPGSQHKVISTVVPTKIAILRSRRD